MGDNAEGPRYTYSERYEKVRSWLFRLVQHILAFFERRDLKDRRKIPPELLLESKLRYVGHGEPWKYLRWEEHVGRGTLNILTTLTSASSLSLEKYPTKHLTIKSKK